MVASLRSRSRVVSEPGTGSPPFVDEERVRLTLAGDAARREVLGRGRWPWAVRLPFRRDAKERARVRGSLRAGPVRRRRLHRPHLGAGDVRTGLADDQPGHGVHRPGTPGAGVDRAAAVWGVDARRAAAADLRPVLPPSR